MSTMAWLGCFASNLPRRSAIMALIVAGSRLEFQRIATGTTGWIRSGRRDSVTEYACRVVESAPAIWRSFRLTHMRAARRAPPPQQRFQLGFVWLETRFR